MQFSFLGPHDPDERPNCRWETFPHMANITSGCNSATQEHHNGTFCAKDWGAGLPLYLSFLSLQLVRTEVVKAPQTVWKLLVLIKDKQPFNAVPPIRNRKSSTPFQKHEKPFYSCLLAPISSLVPDMMSKVKPHFHHLSLC